MCGIAAAFAKGPLGPNCARVLMLRALQRLNHRGYDSWGYACASRDGSIGLHRELGELNKEEEENALATYWLAAIGHTRWATHGEVSLKNTHPIVGGHHETTYVVHNGIVENHEQLRASLSREFHFNTGTDTEVLAHLFAKNYSKYLPELAFARTMKSAKGKFAVVALHRHEFDSLFLFARESTLFVGTKEDTCCVVIASEEQALVGVDRFFKIPNNFVVHIDMGTMKVYNQEMERIDPESLTWFTAQASQFVPEVKPKTMLEEIREQADILGDLSSYQGKLEISSEVPTDCYLIGCGSSYHAGLVAEKWMLRAGYNARAIYATESDSLGESLGNYFFLSQSGETKDTLEAQRSLYNNGRVFKRAFAITSSNNSTLAQACPGRVELPTGRENGVAATKTFTAQLAYLYWLAHPEGKTLPREARGICQENYTEQAKELAQYQNALFLGRGLLYPIALEAALKLKEVSYIHAEGLHAGEIKHGPIALIDHKTICLFLVGKNKPESVISNMEQVLSRGGKVWAAVTASVRESQPKEFWGKIHRVFIIPEVPEELEVFPFVIWAQLLAYYTAKAKGLKPERPRSLAKVITV